MRSLHCMEREETSSLQSVCSSSHFLQSLDGTSLARRILSICSGLFCNRCRMRIPWLTGRGRAGMDDAGYVQLLDGYPEYPCIVRVKRSD